MSICTYLQRSASINPDNERKEPGYERSETGSMKMKMSVC